jgi:hypothetical protein
MRIKRKIQNFVEVDHHNENCKDGYIFPRPDSLEKIIKISTY